MSGLDWAGLMRVGLAGLRLRPEDFWKLTPAEFALMLGDVAEARPMDRAGLRGLMAAWPDGGGTGDERRGSAGKPERQRGEP